MALIPDEEKYIKETGLRNLKDRFPQCSYGHIRSDVESWMVDIGKNGNISITYCPYEWQNKIEWGKP